MRTRVRALLIVSTCSLPLVLTAVAVLRGPHGVSAQKTPTSDINVSTGADASSKELENRPVMVTALRNGAVVRQQEGRLGYTISLQTLPLGEYEVRLEGEGMTTLVKRGIHVTEGRHTNLQGVMRAGKGVCECRYAQ